ncbi:hypothetical protein GGR50DRAFT_639098, partial [Xylaria sp. CBS 124048]
RRRIHHTHAPPPLPLPPPSPSYFLGFICDHPWENVHQVVSPIEISHACRKRGVSFLFLVMVMVTVRVMVKVDRYIYGGDRGDGGLAGLSAQPVAPRQTDRPFSNTAGRMVLLAMLPWRCCLALMILLLMNFYLRADGYSFRFNHDETVDGYAVSYSVVVLERSYVVS